MWFLVWLTSPVNPTHSPRVLCCVHNLDFVFCFFVFSAFLVWFCFVTGSSFCVVIETYCVISASHPFASGEFRARHRRPRCEIEISNSPFLLSNTSLQGQKRQGMSTATPAATAPVVNFYQLYRRSISLPLCPLPTLEVGVTNHHFFHFFTV